MTNRLEHHLPAEHEFHRLTQLPRRRGGERTMRPWKKLAAETRPDELGDDADVLLRQTEHLRKYGPEVDYSLRRIVQRQSQVVPDRGRRVQLDGVVCLGRRDIGLVDLDRRAGECGVSITTLTLQAMLLAERGEDHFGIIVRFKLRLNVRL